LKLFTSNVRGILKHWDVIKQINFSKYDVLMFCEIWQVREYENLKIDNFKLATSYQRTDQRGGGVIIFVRENIKYEVINSIVVPGLIETAAVKINKILLVVLYRPPSGNKNQFIEKLIEWIESNRNDNIYIAGDYNLNYLNHERQYFEKIREETGLLARLSQPTRLESGTCIDNIVTNIEKNHEISTICIADHQGLVSKINIRTPRLSPKEYTYREMSERNWNRFGTKLSELTIAGSNVNDKWDNLCNNIKVIVESSFPEKKSKIKYMFSMSQGLIKSRNKKNRLLRKYRNGKLASETK